MLKEGLAALEEETGYVFRNKELLALALTHSSYANENKSGNRANNERLEFLGDAVLELVISEYVFKHFGDMPEGGLTKLRAGIVCEPTIAKKARELSFNRYVFLGKGEEQSRENMRDSILADTFEAVTGAIYLDGGLAAAKNFLLRVLSEEISELKTSYRNLDCKTRLQEVVQRSGKKTLSYTITDERGPDHNKIFAAQVNLNGEPLGAGEGRSKKEAEQSAAYDALQKLGDKNQ